MKYLLPVLLALITSVTDAGSAVPAGCASPPTLGSKRIFYVDPVRGSMDNDGSVNRPWRTLREVLAKGLIATNQYPTPYRVGVEAQKANSSGPIRPGDTIYLRNGEHGEATVTGVNDQFITIQAEPGQTPVINRLAIYGASKWIVRGITFRNAKGGDWLVQALNHKWQGPSENIIIEENAFLPNSDANTWSQKDWITNSSSGIKTEARCATVRANRISTVRTGIYVTGEHSLIEGNIIDHFGGDGIDLLAGNASLVGNRITNNHDVGDANHNDGIQGWIYTEEGNSNVLIEKNVVINSTHPSLKFPGELQGISIFDGKWRNVRVLNNCVITNHWHGIAMYGIRDSIIEGNRVAATDPKKETWITVKDRKPAQGGTPPQNVIVRNNIAPNFVLPTDRTQVVSEGNKNQRFANPTVAGHECGSR